MCQIYGKIVVNDRLHLVRERCNQSVSKRLRLVSKKLCLVSTQLCVQQMTAFHASIESLVQVANGWIQ